MKNFLSLALVVFFIIGLTACQETKTKAETEKLTELKTPKTKLGYALGADVGKSFRTFKENDIQFDIDAFIQGFTDGLNDSKPLMTPDEIRATQKETIAKLRKSMSEKKKAVAEDNIKAGEKFLAENGAREGVVTTESGLQYQILTKGEGPVPAKTDTVKVNYVGTLLNGKEFDSSYKRGEPVEFRVTGVIKGWTEALTLMPVGSKWKLFIPGDLAYGPRGSRKEIGPNETLIFEVELLEIVKKDQKKKNKPEIKPKKK